MGNERGFNRRVLFRIQEHAVLVFGGLAHWRNRTAFRVKRKSVGAVFDNRFQRFLRNHLLLVQLLRRNDNVPWNERAHRVLGAGVLAQKSV